MSLTLTCNVSGKKVTWHNKQIIAKRIAAAGGEAALRASYVCREAKPKKQKVRSGMLVPRDGDITSVMKAIMQDGVRLGKMSRDEYQALMEKAREKNAMVA